jgi:hsp70-interacting protein
MSSAQGDGKQWAWLGLLKWSLSYTDGTSDSPAQPMSAEDRAFLEEVMKDGILDENERMKFILEKLTAAMEVYQNIEGAKGSNDDLTDELQDLLLELRDICEQIDFARAFCSLQGLPFLLGCIQERAAVPIEIRTSCFSIIATVCQNNPPVQLQLLELGSLKILSDLFFVEGGNSVKAKIIQAMSANVRNHDLAEQVFCQVEQATQLMQEGLGLGSDVSETLQKRTLFFLRALITADTADRARVRQFNASIEHVADTFLTEENSADLRELSLEFLVLVLQQKNSVNVLLGSRKAALATLGVQRIAKLRSMPEGEEKEFAAVELQHWEQLLVLLARAEPDAALEAEPVLMLGAGTPASETLPQ